MQITGKSFRHYRIVLQAGVVLMCLVSEGHYSVAYGANAANNYIGPPAGSLTTTSNWSLNHLPGVAEDAVFTATTGIRTLTAANLTVGSFDVTANTGTFSIRNETSLSTNSTLTLGGAGDLGNSVSGNAADLLYAATGSTFNIRGDNPNGTGTLLLVLGQSGNFDAAGSISISTAISDGGNGFGITKTGAGTLTFSAANSYGGGTTVQAGTLLLSGAGTLGSTNGTLTISAGTLNLNATSQAVGALNGSGGTITNDPGSSNTGSTLTVGSGNASGSYAGTITDVGTGSRTLALTKIGTGTEILTGSNSYRGATTISSGTLLVNGSTAAASAVTVNGSGSTLGGTGTVNGPVSVTSSNFLEGGNGTTGTTLTLKGALTLNSNSMIELTLGPSGSHSTLARGTGAGTWTFAANQAFTFIDGGATPGLYDNIITGLASNPNPGTWTITNSGWTGTFTFDGTNIDLNLTMVPEPGTWFGAALTLGAIGYSQRKRLRAIPRA